MNSHHKSEVKKTSKYPKYFFVLFFLVVLVTAFFIVRPFISTLILAAIIAYILYPVYGYFHRLTQMRSFSAIILIIMLLLLVAIPLLMVAGKVTKESYSLYQDTREMILEAGPVGETCVAGSGFLCSAYSSVLSLSAQYGLDFDVQVARALSSGTAYIFSRASDFILGVPKLLLHIFVGLFAMFYMFTQGEMMIKSLKSALPLKEEDSSRILQQFNDIIYATIYGAIVIAIIQGILASIGFFIFNVSSPLIFGLLTLVAAFIPFLGAALVWVPVAISMFIQGYSLGDSHVMLMAFGLFMYGAFVISVIDNFLRPKIVGSRAKVHPLVILLGVFGGIALFGFIGAIIGPLLLTLFIASLKIYEQEKEHII